MENTRSRRDGGMVVVLLTGPNLLASFASGRSAEKSDQRDSLFLIFFLLFDAFAYYHDDLVSRLAITSQPDPTNIFCLKIGQSPQIIPP